ncbi:MAG: hypothetical protein ACI90V_003775 [Bacillariaceae sp.]|jgi:hypothetical protein
MESNNNNNQPQSPPLAKFDITKLVAGTIDHRRYHQRRLYAERKASGKIKAPPKTKVTKKKRKEYYDRYRSVLKQLQSGKKRKRYPVTKKNRKENENGKKKLVQKLLRSEADAPIALSSLKNSKRISTATY